MAEDTADLTLELLRQIRADVGSFRTDVERRFELSNHRFDKLESDMLEVKQTLRGMAYIMATFTGRLEDVEMRTRVLEQR